MSLATRALSIGSVVSAVIAGSLLHPVVMGHAGHTTRQGVSIGAGLWSASASFAALALLLGFAAYRHHLDVDLPSRRRLAAPAFAFLVVSTAVLGGAGGGVGTAQAGYFDDCEFQDSLVLAVGSSLGLSNQDCAFYTPDYGETIENVTGTDAYATGVGLKDTSTRYISTFEHFSQDSKSVAWAKAKITIINELNNGSSEQAAMDAANATIEEYYANQQRELSAQFDSYLLQVSYLSDATGGQWNNDGGGTDQVHGGSDNSWDNSHVLNRTGEYQLELVNGENISAKFLLTDLAGTSTEGNTMLSATYGSNLTYDYQASPPANYRDLAIENVAGGNYTVMIDNTRWKNAFHQTHTDAGLVKDNVAAFVPNVYANISSGNLTVDDLVDNSPTAIASQAATDFNSTGYYGFSNAMLSSLSVSGDTNASHVVETTWSRTVERDNNTATESHTVNVTGTLFYTGEDSQTFDTGTTYDPTALSGEVYMSVASITNTSTGDSMNYSDGMLHVDSSFTIHSATNAKTGEPINTTTMETRDYTSTNTSELEAELDQLREERDYYMEQATAAGTDSGGSSNTVLIAAIALAAGGALMWRRDDD